GPSRAGSVADGEVLAFGPGAGDRDEPRVERRALAERDLPRRVRTCEPIGWAVNHARERLAITRGAELPGVVACNEVGSSEDDGAPRTRGDAAGAGRPCG